MAELQAIHPYDLSARLVGRNFKTITKLRDGALLLNGMWYVEDWNAPVQTEVGLKLMLHYHARMTG